MDIPRIQTPAELFQFTREYSNSRYIAAFYTFGESTIVEAELENAVEAALLPSLTSADGSDSIALGTSDDINLGPAFTVSTAHQVFDSIEFDKVAIADITDSLSGYRLLNILPGHISLDYGMRDSEGKIVGPSFTIDATFTKAGEDFMIRKTVKDGAAVAEFIGSEYDNSLVFRAANLLLTSLSKDQHSV